MRFSPKEVLGPLYPYYIRLRTSDTSRDLAALAGLPAYLSARRRSPGTLSVAINGRRGLGATISEALLFHGMAERDGLCPHIISANPLYAASPTQDVLARYFQREPSRDHGVPIRGNAYLWAARKVAPAHLPLADAQALFARHFKPAPIIREAIDSVKDGRDAFDLSVHVRGTDKVLESGRIDINSVFAAVDAQAAISSTPLDVFLATDDAAFEAAFRKRYPAFRITTYNLEVLAPGVPRHFSTMKAEAKALEAVVNIFLIALAPVCIRTSSYLSAISKISNPALRTHTVNTTLGGSALFPEREVLAAEHAEDTAERYAQGPSQLA